MVSVLSLVKPVELVMLVKKPGMVHGWHVFISHDLLVESDTDEDGQRLNPAKAVESQLDLKRILSDEHDEQLRTRILLKEFVAGP